MIGEISDAKRISIEQAHESMLIKGVDTHQMADEGRIANKWLHSD